VTANFFTRLLEVSKAVSQFESHPSGCGTDTRGGGTDSQTDVGKMS
jgi:hypothetical protein